MPDAYQGQEKDPETGKEAFELRLWDARIGRWLTTDPKGQYSSPYLGMGNNPITGVDPDGGWDKIGLNVETGELSVLEENNSVDIIHLTTGKNNRILTEKEGGASVRLQRDGQVATALKDPRGFNLQFTNDKVSTEVFRFLAHETNVEWSQIKYGKSSSFVASAFDEGASPLGAAILLDLLSQDYRNNVREFTHSHPLNDHFLSAPSGFLKQDKNYGRGDKLAAKELRDAYPKHSVKLKVYDVTTLNIIEFTHNSYHIINNR